MVRRWSVRHARGLERIYNSFEPLLRVLRPVIRRFGERSVERPLAVLERGIKGFFFDCKMCGQCALSHTGMACPMNCPKHLRNGPCGGVRPDGTCEVDPAIVCVWVEAWQGAQRMSDRDRMLSLHRPVDHSRQGRSSWLRVLREGGSGTLWRRKDGSEARP